MTEETRVQANRLLDGIERALKTVEQSLMEAHREHQSFKELLGLGKPENSDFVATVCPYCKEWATTREHFDESDLCKKRLSRRLPPMDDECRSCHRKGYVMDEFTSPYTGLCAQCSHRKPE